MLGYVYAMRPVTIEQVGDELAIKWDDNRETFLQFQALRRFCPCAGCKGETDIMGITYKDSKRALTPAAFQLVRFSLVGNYALNLVWADGHSSGIYAFEYLRKIEEVWQQS